MPNLRCIEEINEKLEKHGLFFKPNEYTNTGRRSKLNNKPLKKTENDKLHALGIQNINLFQNIDLDDIKVPKIESRIIQEHQKVMSNG